MRLIHTILLLVCPIFLFAKSPAVDSLYQETIIQLKEEIITVKQQYEFQQGLLRSELYELDSLANNGFLTLQVLSRKLEVREELELLEEEYGVELTKNRYKKGLAIIKLLYEKILDLDHHFSTLRTQQSIANLTNPNTYPEFQQAKKVLKQKMERSKVNWLSLPSLLESNPYISGAFSLISSILGNNEKRQGSSEESLDEIACIMDFTIRMYADLNTIYYETEFLRQSNEALKEECIKLFGEYVEVVDYHTPLPICRNEDDWEKITESLNAITEKIKNEIIEDAGKGQTSAFKKQVDLEFSVDRLLTFIENYNALVSQGEKYYHKFEKILSNYSNEACIQQLSSQYEYTDIQHDVQNSIRKFKEAYNISELKGSKLKSLLYGYNS